MLLIFYEYGVKSWATGRVISSALLASNVRFRPTKHYLSDTTDEWLCWNDLIGCLIATRYIPLLFYLPDAKSMDNYLGRLLRMVETDPYSVNPYLMVFLVFPILLGKIGEK